MAFPKSGPPPSRVGRRQVIVFLPPAVVDRAKAVARARGETLQQILARAINAALGLRGIPPVLTCERRHLFVRVQKAAQERGPGKAADCRVGLKPIAGWFDRPEVAKLADTAGETGTTVQALASEGFGLILAGSSGDGPGADDGGDPGLHGLVPDGGFGEIPREEELPLWVE